MATTIELKNSVTTGNSPSSLAQGETGWNITDKKVWIGNASSTPIQLIGAGASMSLSSLAVSTVGSSSGNLSIQAGGSTYATLNTSGYLGIGTSSPTAQLDVNVSNQGNGINCGDFTSAASSTIPFIQMLGTRQDGNQTFGGRFGASYRRADGTAISSGTQIGWYNFGGQYGTDTSYQSSKLLYAAGIAGVAESNFTASNAMSTGIAFYTGSTGYAINAVNLTYGSERMRIDSSGNLLVGVTANDILGNRTTGFAVGPSLAGGQEMVVRASLGAKWSLTATNATHMYFYSDNGSSVVLGGNISTNGSVTSYNVTSDYRLKENVNLLKNSLSKVLQLKPCSYNYIEGKQYSEGFIAHELQSIVPQAVTGEKDAVDEEGKPIYQSVDTSFLVATLTAAIQELNAKVEAQAATITALQAKVGL